MNNFDAEPLPATLKGLSSKAVGLPLEALGSLGLSLLAGDLPLPAAVLKESALAHNLGWMAAFAERSSARLCPHGKTTMSPQLFARQLQTGAWGITAATAGHVRTYRHFGVQRVLLANQLVGRANIDLVFDELEADPGFDFYCLVDSLDGLAHLQAALIRRPLARPLQVLLEVGVAGGRTGVRTFEDGVALGRALRHAAPAVSLRGVEAFEGVGGGVDEARIELAVHTMLDTVAALAQTGCDEHWFAPGEIILTAGGSAFSTSRPLCWARSRTLATFGLCCEAAATSLTTACTTLGCNRDCDSARANYGAPARACATRSRSGLASSRCRSPRGRSAAWASETSRTTWNYRSRYGGSARVCTMRPSASPKTCG